MTNHILPQETVRSASPQSVAWSLHQLFTVIATEHERRLRWLTLLDTAARNLQCRKWEFDGTSFVIDDKRHMRASVTLWGCSCQKWIKQRECWHYAALRIVMLAHHFAYLRTTSGFISPASLQADIELLFR